jgi:outer membrane receptor protein involved in Fe transport
VQKTVDDYGATESYGGSLALKWIVNDRLDVNLRFLMQQSNSDGWSAPYANLTDFSVNSFTMQRTNDIQEQARDQFYLPSLQINYKGDGYGIKQSLSYFDRIATQIEDGSEGTRDALVADWNAAYPGIAALDNNWVTGAGTNTLNQGFPWTETVSYRRITSETQWSLDKTAGGFSAISGVYLSHSYSNTYLNGGNLPLIQQLGLNTNAAVGGTYCGNGTMTCSSYGSGLVWESNQPMNHNDTAIFGEMYQQFGDYELTLGGRLYDQRQDGNEYAAGALNFAQLNLKVPDTEQKGFNPKVAIKYNFDPTAMVYASFSKGFRSGGAGVPLPTGPSAFFEAIHQQPNTPTTYTSDFVKNYEVGGKFETAGGRVTFSGALYQMDWSNIQQTIIAPVTYITLIVNAGDAQVRGGEFEVNAKATDAINLHAGVGYTDAKIVKGALYWQPTGSDVYNTPKLTANASVTYSAPINDTLSSFVTLDGSYTGSSYSGTAGCQLNTSNPAFNGGGTAPFFPCPQVSPTDYSGYPPQRAGFTVANLHFGLDWGRSELAMYVQNLTNAHPNLGDFNPESYAKHSTDPNEYDAAFGTGYIIPRVATLRPMNIGITFRQKF